jgi:ribosomal protein S6--L-glutamate ligase
MVLVNPSTCRDLRGELEKFRSAGNPTLYIQQKLSLPERDLGVVFLGGEHVGTYARVKSGSSWNTTTHDGGHYAPHSASPEIIDLAFRAQALFDMDLTSVDVVETPDGPRVFEVSAFGGFRGCLTALNIDLAERYADYVVQRAKR